MPRSRKLVVAVSAAMVVITVSAVALFRGHGADNPPETPPAVSTTLNLGVTYLPVTPRLAAYYHLGVDFGAMVTEVVPFSPADQAGIQVSDVILSFNGTGLEEGSSLLGMMMACPAGSRVTLEVWQGKSQRTIELVHQAAGGSPTP
ncbi:MAG: PDZ domain-containing protein [Chloroflexota bacterium]